MFRNAMGDFDTINKSLFLNDKENVIFWFMFLLFLIVGNIVFLNFVIAEAGNSYNKVKANLEEFIMQEKSALIDEAELMIPRSFRKD